MYFSELLAFTLAVFMALKENPYIVPHLIALISGFLGWADVWQFSKLVNALMKISILLHKIASDWFILSTAVTYTLNADD